MSKPSGIHLYTVGTPNGIKISILLEELDLKYEWTKIDFGKKEQKEPWFLEINPNGRIPAITDTFTDGKSIRLFESGSIMQYIIEAYDTEHKFSYPRGTREYWEVNNWLFFQNAGVGPMQGQSNHFTRYAPEKIQYGIERYQNETRRLYGVLDKHLEASSSGFLVGDRLTIADVAHWGWVKSAWWAGVNLDDFPALKKWEQTLLARPAFQRGRAIPDPPKDDKMDAKAIAKAEEDAKKWILSGQADDAKK